MPCFRLVLKYPDITRLAKKESRGDLAGRSTRSAVYMSNRLLVEATVSSRYLSLGFSDFLTGLTAWLGRA